LLAGRWFNELLKKGCDGNGNKNRFSANEAEYVAKSPAASAHRQLIRSSDRESEVGLLLPNGLQASTFAVVLYAAPIDHRSAAARMILVPPSEVALVSPLLLGFQRENPQAEALLITRSPRTLSHFRSAKKLRNQRLMGL